MNIDQYQTLAKDIVNLALKKGAETVEVSINDRQKFEVVVRNSEIETLLEAGSSNLIVVLSKAKRKSSVSSSDLKEESINRLLDDAVKLVEYSEMDEYLSLPDIDELGKADVNLNIFDSGLINISPAKKINIAREVESLAFKQDNRLTSEGAEVSTVHLKKIFANSLNYCESYELTNSSVGISLFVEDPVSGENKNKKQSDGWYSTNVFFDRLDPLEEIAKIAADRTLRKLGAKKPKTQNVPVIFEPEMGASFISSVASAGFGANIYKKQSFLCDKVGEKLGSQVFTLIDNPLIPEMVGSRPFDSEGVRSRKNLIFKNGNFNQYLLDTYSANKLKLKTTGNAGGYSNLYLKNGVCSVEDIISSVKEGLFLTFMSGHGANIINGDYSRGAQGIWIEDGKLSYPVNEFTITSNFIEMMNNIQMIGNDLKLKFNVNSPTFKVEKMTISGT